MRALVKNEESGKDNGVSLGSIFADVAEIQ